jgi:hopanoid biosynthesis associated RND transporter like protein HpnN
MSAAADAIGAWLARWVGGVLARPRLTAALTLLATVFAVYYATGRLGVNTDTANMIDASLTWRQHFNEFREAFPARDRNLLIVIDAATPAAADDYSAALLAELRKQPELYRSILLAGEGEFFARNGLLYLSPDELTTLVDRLAAAQPLLGLLKARFDGAAVLDVATRTLTAAPAGDAAALEPFYGRLAESLQAAAAGTSQPLAWSSLIAAGAQPTARRVVVLQPSFDFGRIQPAATAIEGIRAAVVRLDAAEAAPVTVRLTGSVAMEHEELASVSRGAGIGALATLVMVALVLYAALRSWRLLAISLVTLIAGLGLTAAFAAAAVGHLNLLSVAFVVLNVGLGSDYVIHVLLRYKELVATGRATDEALLETMRGVGSSLVLCAVTTAAGFYSFIPTTFSGVSELGLIAGTGVFFGLFVSVTLLPALVKLYGGELRRHAGATWIDPRIFVPLNGRPRAVLAATAVVVVLTAGLLPWVTFDSNPIHLRDPRSESVTTLLELAATGEAPLLNLAAVAPDDATAADWAAQLRALPEVRSVVTLANLVPQRQDEKLALLEDLDLLLGPEFADLNAGPAQPGAVAQALAALAAAAPTVSAARPLAAAAADLEARLAAQTPAARDATLAALDVALTTGLPAQLRRLATALTAAPFGRDALPAELEERWLAADGRELVEIVPREDVSDNAAASRFIAAVQGVVPTATGPPVVYQEASATVVAAFEKAFVYAFIMVTAIILLVLRDAKDTLLVVVPILVAAVVTAGCTVLIGMPLNYANIIALPLLVGIGVDNGIHVVHRMRTDTAAQLFDTSTMRAVLASGLTTVASFGNLAFSAHVGTASMGILLALGLAVSMAATLIALPAWLKLFGARTRSHA